MLRTTRVLRANELAIVLTLFVAAPLTPSPASAARGDCSQPATNGSKPAATDCLFILNVAVGLTSCTPECICAPKGSLPTAATDALVCLQVAVDQPVPLACPCDGTTTTTSPSGTTTTTLPGGSTTTVTFVSTTTTSTTVPATCPAQLAAGFESAPAIDAENGVASACECFTNEGNTCDGACPGDNAACFPPQTPGELCQCRGFGCGEDEGLPACNGLCPEGEACTSGIDSCQCEPVTDAPCGEEGQGSVTPQCDGTCPTGQVCRQIVASCTCVDVSCGAITGAPYCLGVCGAGLACKEISEGVCGCAGS